MNKFKTSFFGYKKRSVEELLKQLQTEHESKKQVLENELNGLKTIIAKSQ